MKCLLSVQFWVLILSNLFNKQNESNQGIVVPGGFGERGIEGKIATCKYARENGIPFLGAL